MCSGVYLLMFPTLLTTQSPFIHMINVGYCGLEEQTITLLLRSVRANCALQVLKMQGNNLSGKGTFILSKRHLCAPSVPLLALCSPAPLFPLLALCSGCNEVQ